MRYGFVNNFSQALAADLAAGATTLELDGGGADLSAATTDLVYTLTLDDGEGALEILHVTGASANTLTVIRGQEGTADATWPTGTTVEMRVTAAAVGSAVFTTTSNNTIGLGASITGASSAIALGSAASVTANYGVALGEAATASGNFGFALGPYATASGANAVAVGFGNASGFNSIAIGEGAGASLGGCTALGANSSSSSGNATAVGAGSSASGASAVGLGDGATASGGASVAIGTDTAASADGAIAIGEAASCSISGGYACTALPYLPATIAGGSATASAARQAASQVVVVTDPLDLTSGTAAVTLDLPTGTRLFVDSIDAIITGSDAPGGSPEISVGPDDVTPAAYLASTPVTKTAVGERQMHTPLVLDGVTSLRVATSVAGTGTTYQAKIVFRGYVMEL